jgi:hypothetical protein
MTATCTTQTPAPAARPRAEVLARGLPLLLGRLELRSAPDLGLDVVARCPYCGGEHRHHWPDPPFGADQVEHRVSRCNAVARAAPGGRGGYWVGLDPAAKAHNEAMAGRFLELLAARRGGRQARAGWTPEDGAATLGAIEKDQRLRPGSLALYGPRR